jgi:hypothetical protein
VIPGQIDRAKARSTLMWRPHPQVNIGVEYNPYAKEARPLLTLIPIKETEKRPPLFSALAPTASARPRARHFT